MDARCKNGTDAGLPVRLTGVARSHAGHVVTFSDRYRLWVLFRQRGLHPGDGRQRPRHSAERAHWELACEVRRYVWGRKQADASWQRHVS